jgi:outer membrane protein OmpA-like peptidoglycan-associated protein
MKNNHRLLYILPFFFITILLFSCVPQKKVVTHQQEITSLDSLMMAYRKNLKELDTKRIEKQDNNEMDDSVSSGIKKFIGRTYNEIDILVAQNSILVGDVEVDKKDWNQLQKALALSQNTTKLINDKVSLINDLINRNTVIKLEQDVFFGPGKYTVTPEVISSIGNFFEPAAKEIDAFIKKYPDFPLSLVITAKGYADATTISEGSGLYKDLKDELKLSGKPELTNTDLNQALSTKRAKTVIDLFKVFEKRLASNGNNISHIIFLHEGKGESQPNPKATDYRVDDPRRRVVLLFWGVFPD